MFELTEYSLIAAIIPIVWAIYLRHTTGSGIQIHFMNLDYRISVSIRNGSNNTLFVDDCICYKSYSHKYKFYSSDNKRSFALAPGEEKCIDFDLTMFLQFVKDLGLNKREPFTLRIKLNTSQGVLTTGWIKMKRKTDSQYGFAFINNPRVIILRTDMNPVYSEYINPVLAAFVISCFVASFFLSYEIMANIVVVDLLMILFFGPFTFIKGFKNGKIGSLVCLGLGLLLGLMLVIPTKDISYFMMGAIFFMVIYLDVMICCGGLTLDSE